MNQIINKPNRPTPEDDDESSAVPKGASPLINIATTEGRILAVTQNEAGEEEAVDDDNVDQEGESTDEQDSEGTNEADELRGVRLVADTSWNWGRCKRRNGMVVCH
jgi:hypothetical protein